MSTSQQAALDVRIAFARLRRRLREVSTADGALTALQASVLARVGKGEATTASELARLEIVRPQSMAATLASLEAGGLISRAPDPADGRRQLITLTEAGRALEGGIMDERREWLAARIEERLDESERQTLIAAAALLDRVSAP